MKSISALTENSISLLKDLIRTPSFSGEEQRTARLLADFFHANGIASEQQFNNIFARTPVFDPSLPTLLLNSHHDTVKPNSGWQTDPFDAAVVDGKLTGLGSNDAGASLVSLAAVFCHYYYHKPGGWNIIFAGTGEEESSGPNGIAALLPQLGRIDLAIVGEPTGMELAIAERGLMVLRCRANGIGGHAARDIGKNAINEAINDINWFHNYRFPRNSELLGDIRMTVTMINAGTQHNVIPDACEYTVDVRTTDKYSHDEILSTIEQNISADIIRCSNRLNPSAIDTSHPLVLSANAIGMPTFASATLSDQALISAPSVKIGPGMSERSHTSGEFIYLSEIEQGIPRYIELLDHFFGVTHER